MVSLSKHDGAALTLPRPQADPSQHPCVDLAGCFLYIPGQPVKEARITPEIRDKSLRKL
jgi:hypothetical protein